MEKSEASAIKPAIFLACGTAFAARRVSLCMWSTRCRHRGACSGLLFEPGLHVCLRLGCRALVAEKLRHECGVLGAIASLREAKCLAAHALLAPRTDLLAKLLPKPCLQTREAHAAQRLVRQPLRRQGGGSTASTAAATTV